MVHRTLLVALSIAALLLPGCTSGSGPTGQGPASADATLNGDTSADAERWATCMREHGFDVEVIIEDGMQRFEWDTPEEQDSAAREAIEVCNQQVGRDTGPGVGGDGHGLSEQQAGGLYDYLLSMHECLESEGFPTDDPPTREAFLDDPAGWDPLRQVAEVGREPEAMQACADQGDVVVVE